jgi:hypothetical protein
VAFTCLGAFAGLKQSSIRTWKISTCELATGVPTGPPQERSRQIGIARHANSEFPVTSNQNARSRFALEYALAAKAARNRKIALTAGTRSVGHLLSHCSCGVGPARALRHSRQATRVARASTCSSIAMAQFSIFPADRCALRTCLDRSTAIAGAAHRPLACDQTKR